MKYLQNTAICLMVLLLIAFSSCNRKPAGEHSFAIGNKTFLLDGKPFVIKAAEIHYTRIPAEYWEHRIQLCKALGMNTICIYAFWNIHEQKDNAYNHIFQKFLHYTSPPLPAFSDSLSPETRVTIHIITRSISAIIEPLCQSYALK